MSYVTLWDCGAGEVKRRLKRETDVCALGITNDATRVVIGRAPNQLHIWDPMRSNSLRRARGYEGLRFSVGSRIFVQDDNSRAVVFAEDISLWVSSWRVLCKKKKVCVFCFLWVSFFVGEWRWTYFFFPPVSFIGQ